MKKKPNERGKFDRAMTALFRVPKSEVIKKSRKKAKKGKD
jgi:hypothetical protein